MTTPNQVVGQPTLQQQSVAGAGEAASPWAAYGLNPDGTPIVEQKQQSTPADAEKAALQAKVADLEAKLSKLPEGFEGLTEKIKLFDKVVGALKGDTPDALPQSGEIWSDLKKVAAHQAPAVGKLIALLESDPNYLQRLESANNALMASHITGINQKAHERVLDLAKKAGFKGSNDAELNDMVFPFEQSMTMMINANPDMRRAFLSGDLGLVDDIFNRMIKPHVGQRLREKQARTAPNALPKAAPKGAAQPAQGDNAPSKPDIKTPQGRAAFHQQAVNRWLDKASQSRDDV